MSFFEKFKNRVSEIKPAYVVTQEITLPIYSIDVNNLIDARDIEKKCLISQQGKNNRPDLVKLGWQSPFFIREGNALSIEQFIKFNDIINVVEEKSNSVIGQNLYEVVEFWIVIYNHKSKQEFHNHLPNEPQMKFGNSLTAVYYPKASDQSAPIEFKNKDLDNLRIKIATGQLLIFPSSLDHGVPENLDQETRIAISFNLNIKNQDQYTKDIITHVKNISS